MFDPHVVRKDFPVFERRVHGDKPLIYLDSAATSQKPRQVLKTLEDFYERHNANVHRGVYQLGEEATELYEGARRKVAAFIGAPDPRGVVFVRSATEATNTVAAGWGRKFLKPGDEVLVTEMEHHSNLIPWQMVCAQTGAKLVPFPVDIESGLLQMSALDSLINDRTKIVCVTQMSNVLGTINPIRVIADAAHAAGALVLVDGAQGAPHVVTDVVAMDCDFYALSGHKMLGPTGSGALWARPELLEAMDPFLGGGEMIREVWFDRATYNEIPYKFEAGTPPIAQEIGLGAAADYLTDLGMEQVHAHETELTAYALKKLDELGEVTVHGPRDLEVKGGVISFWYSDIHPHDLGTIVDSFGVCIRAGHHCAQPLMRRLGVPATARASFNVYNTLEDVDALIESLKQAKHIFSGGGGLPF
ncbi:MAG: cysteine desulfurase [Actinomycetota bacterium]